MDCGLLRVTRAGASEPGWPLCVTSDSGHSKFHMLREPGLSDGRWRQSVTLAAASDVGWRAAADIFGMKTLPNLRASHTNNVKYDPLPLATPGTFAFRHGPPGSQWQVDGT